MNLRFTGILHDRCRRAHPLSLAVERTDSRAKDGFLRMLLPEPHPAYPQSRRDNTMQMGGTAQEGQYSFYRELSVGDDVYFTDMEGNRYACTITDIRFEKHAFLWIHHRLLLSRRLTSPAWHQTNFFALNHPTKDKTSSYLTI